mgnify:CR=1 FL=1
MTIIKKIILFAIMIAFLGNIIQPNLVCADGLGDEIGKFEAGDVSQNDTKTLKTVVNKFLGVLRAISGIILVILISTTGYEYIISTPSVKHDIKHRMLPVIIGLILIFGCTSIAALFLKTMGG